ncbi:hypothetical protein [Suipraeoptans intestinalis]|nr:hypothetical protein [Suipraeoptans intestinalis]
MEERPVPAVRGRESRAKRKTPGGKQGIRQKKQTFDDGRREAAWK